VIAVKWVTLFSMPYVLPMVCDANVTVMAHGLCRPRPLHPDDQGVEEERRGRQAFQNDPGERGKQVWKAGDIKQRGPQFLSR
jgi:hypothetical protein